MSEGEHEIQRLKRCTETEMFCSETNTHFVESHQLPDPPPVLRGELREEGQQVFETPGHQHAGS